MSTALVKQTQTSRMMASMAPELASKWQQYGQEQTRVAMLACRKQHASALRTATELESKGANDYANEIDRAMESATRDDGGRINLFASMVGNLFMKSLMSISRHMNACLAATMAPEAVLLQSVLI